jgi:hypothetical protein
MLPPSPALSIIVDTDSACGDAVELSEGTYVAGSEAGCCGIDGEGWSPATCRELWPGSTALRVFFRTTVSAGGSKSKRLGAAAAGIDGRFDDPPNAPGSVDVDVESEPAVAAPPDMKPKADGPDEAVKPNADGADELVSGCG